MCAKRIVLIFLLFEQISYSQLSSSVSVFKTDQAINFDGAVDEAVWKNATSFELTRQSPDYGTDPSEKTDFRMLYDDHYLYIGAKMFSNDPKNIQEFSKQRDGSGPMDWIGFAFDGYNDKTTGLAFATTPAGNRWDGTITVNGGDINISTEWNTYWEVKTTRDQQGWYAEFKIPLSSLRFKSNTEDVVMNFIIWRKITYNNEFSVYPDYPPNWGLFSFANISMGKPLIFKGIKRSKPIYVTPYGLSGFSNNKEIDTELGKFTNHYSRKFNAGADIKYALSPQLTIDATINTDFAQVEVDNFQVNLTRASLYFPEKREFFLERQSNFSFPFENNNDVFYSRRIGLEENGEIATIYGGVRLSGRVKKFDIGVLSMQTEDKLLASTKNLSLVRVKKQIRNTMGYIGGIFTSSLGANGNDFYNYGIDGQVELPKNNFFKIAAAKTESPEEKNAILKSNNLRFNARLEKTTEKDFNYALSYSIVGTDYLPVLGFEERGNVIIYHGNIGYSFFPSASKTAYKHLFKLNVLQYNNFLSKNKESFLTDLTYMYERKNGGYLYIRPYSRQEFLSEPLILSENTIIPSGSYNFDGINLEYSTATSKSWNSKFTIDTGEFYDGHIKSFAVFGRWDGSKVVQLQLKYQYDKINFGDHTKNFENHLASLNSLFTFSTKHSLSSLIQYDHLNNKIGANIRYRYNPKEGNDLFILLTNINNTDVNRGEVKLPRIQSWQIFLKYRFTFKL